MKKFVLLSAVAVALATLPAQAGDRYATPPPLTLSPDLASPWLLQLQPNRRVRATAPQPTQRVIVTRKKQAKKRYQPRVQPMARQRVAALNPPKPQVKGIDPIYLPRQVNYNGNEKPGTIVISTRDRFLYLVEPGGKAMRYGVGVGKQGFSWTGTERITRKREWPSWRPPAEMIAREKKKGKILPTFMEGGPSNPLGARALYLGSTLYRIHGTNAPWTIGGAVSSGCIRMRNEDVSALYNRVSVGAKVIVR
ncbi:L,D-transpeptidase [Ahrensia marina]|uniref:ErfK/YbiS/YcfS/YnhG family protein n=1 Tax=Ahrensia marina TaxID=1514904 RepID=A0A0N0VM32_9HYPH|nr:L,D-transpeptidase [Ahrensia marina]KPB02541.1 ErfK/YbiS/YcfS/YnhG family protein [Ahrensia marina]